MKNILINPKILSDKKRNEINDVIDHALIKWLINNSYNPIVLPNLITNLPKKKIILYLKKLNLKGIILSGGNDVKKNSIRYLMELFLIKYSISKKIPLLGLCQGMQMLGVCNGSKLIKVKNHVKKNHKLINFSKEKFPKFANSYHDYSLKNCPKGFEITTTSESGDIESIKHKKYPLEGWMWHPERDLKINPINNYRLKNLFK